jgi:exopolysaccharide biosynthesis polyprenyl glycosylphosphotransferase
MSVALAAPQRSGLLPLWSIWAAASRTLVCVSRCTPGYGTAENHRSRTSHIWVGEDVMGISFARIRKLEPPPTSTTPTLTAAAHPAPSSVLAPLGTGAAAAPIPLRLTSSDSARRRVRPYDRLLFVELCRSTDIAVALLMLGTAFLVANADRMPQGWDDFLLLRLNFSKLLELSVFALLWQQIFRLFGLYEKDRMPSLRDEALSVVAACTLGALASFGFALLSESGAFHGAVPLFAWPPIVIATLSARYAVRKLAERSQRHGAKRVLVVGSGPLAHRLYREFIDQQVVGDRELVGFVDSNPNIQFAEIRARMVGTLEQLESILMHVVVDEVLIALPIKSRYTEIQRVIEECERAGVQSRYSPDVFRTTIASARLDLSDRRPAVAMHVAPDDHRLIVKRATDIVGAAIGLVLTAPLLALIAIAIKVTSPGPVLFMQERYGWRKRRFRMLKFRTMVTNAEALQVTLEGRNEAVGPVFKIRDDQLWNVLRGDMSLVGPRPLPIRDVSRFSEAWLMRRFSVMPGITGLWQISGRSNLGFHQWVALDLEYIDRWSLALDILILVRTLPAVFRATGAS